MIGQPPQALNAPMNSAEQVVERMERLSEKANNLADRQESRLHPILHGNSYPNGMVTKGEVAQTHPPLFEKMLAMLDNVEFAIDRMAATLDRAAV